ncbi:MAG: hypothetical protein PGN16_08370 [Sphingomonas phyllosphaerae]
MRQLAWLNAVPQPPPGSRRAEVERQPNKVSRLDKMKADGVPVQFPPNSAPHITHRLIEIGLMQSGAGGAVPLSWGEISAWQTNVHTRLEPWEARLIRALSIEYVAEGRRSESENAPSPWRAPITQREIDLEIAALEALFGP